MRGGVISNFRARHLKRGRRCAMGNAPPSVWRWNGRESWQGHPPTCARWPRCARQRCNHLHNLGLASAHLTEQREARADFRWTGADVARALL